MRLHLLLALALGFFLAGLPLRAQDMGQINNQASCTYSDSEGRVAISAMTTRSVLVDPHGLVLGCDGAPLPGYQGFQIGLYDPDPSDPTGTEVKSPIQLTATALPAAPPMPTGVTPNTTNSNPYAMSDAGKGWFSLLLDPSRGQLDQGRTYILLLSPPPGSAYRTRRVRIVIGARDGQSVTYTATSLDGEPVSGINGKMSATRTMIIAGAGADGQGLAGLSLTLTDCPSHEIAISKSGDRSTAEPGDTVIYRILVSNPTTMPMTNIQIQDTLPQGFDLRTDSIRGAVAGTATPVTVQRDGSVAVFQTGGLLLLPGQSLTLAYATLLTPDALRGDGKNSATVTANTQMTFGGTTMTSPVSDGPAVFSLQVRQGLLTDTGTVLGRVWLDRNRDGEQQNGEPGIPNAVVLLDDSTRIVADLNGLFSLATVTAGYHTAVLDMQSVPGYVLARNHRFSERNSQSRLIHVQPGGMVRLNFGIVPAHPEAQSASEKGGPR